MIIGLPSRAMKWFASLFRLPATALLLASTSASGSASTLPFEFGAFRSLCAYVEAEQSPPTPVELTNLNEQVGHQLATSLSALNVHSPISVGPTCLNKRFDNPKQLTLHVVLATAADPVHHDRVALSMILHTYFRDRSQKQVRDIPKPPHVFPTSVRFCPLADLTQCAADQVAAYLNETFVKIIQRAQQLLKGG